MPPKRPHADSSDSEQGGLDFNAWKAKRAGGQTQAVGDESTYDPSGEEPPDKLWYTLDHHAIANRVDNMCHKLLRSIRRFAAVDQEINDLIMALRSAKATPIPTKINIAVVGDQGIGKSSLINALLHRDLVDVSASSSACTAFATIIQHKKGASDDTTASDIEIEFLKRDEIREFIEEQVRRYADVYNPQIPSDQMGGDEENAMAESSDEEGVLSTLHPNGAKMRKVSDALQRGADTAKDFFHIIFGTKDDVDALQDLQGWLQHPDLEDGHFLEHCVDIAMKHLADIHATEGNLTYADVTDQDLQGHREFAATIWPLVRSVTIYTGFILLRNGICFLDLPGYGALNQTRTAVVNDYRRRANFEMVVAKSDRYLSSTVQDRYLTRAIRQHEARNTILVLNKADSFLTTGAAEIQKLISTITEEPFATLKRNLINTTKLAAEDPALVRAYRNDLMKDAKLAYIMREAGHVRQQMLAKGVEVFSVSAGQYMIWKDPLRFEDPLCEPEVSGIPSLRRFLLALPAEANYQDLTDHIFEVLPDVEDQIGRILGKFEVDDAYTELRAHLSQQMSTLSHQLKAMSITNPRRLIPKLWTLEEKQIIVKNLEVTVNAWRSPQVHHASFTKMLRENGIPLTGKAKGRNFNEEILRQYSAPLRHWRKSTKNKAEELGLLFDEPVQALLHDIQHRFDQTPADPELKCRANEALRKAVRRITIAQGKLVMRLEDSVSENFLYFSTEDDVHGPIAQTMKSIYPRVLQMNPGQKSRITYQREELTRTLTQTTITADSILDAMRLQIMSRQTRGWESACEAFATEVLQLLEDFATVTQNLLVSEDQDSTEHLLIRKKLSRHVPEFQRAETRERVLRFRPSSPAQKRSVSSRRLGSLRTCLPGLRILMIDDRVAVRLL